MAHDDKTTEFPCACGKVFRRQLALERHRDVHHSTRSASHRCEVCGKTFGSRNTLTMHRTVHGTQTNVPRSNSGSPASTPPPPSVSASPEGVSVGGLGRDEDLLGSEAVASDQSVIEGSSNTVETDLEVASSEMEKDVEICADDDDEEFLETPCGMRLETENDADVSQISGPSLTTDDSGNASAILATTEASGGRSAMTLSDVQPQTELRNSDPCQGLSDPGAVSVASVLDLFNGPSSYSSTANLMLSSDCGAQLQQQSVEFSEMLVEEIVSESLFLQQSDEHLLAASAAAAGDEDSNLDVWSQSESASSVELNHRPDYDNRTKRHPRGVEALATTVVDSQPPPQRRTGKAARPDGAPKRNSDRARQARVSVEVDVETGAEYLERSPPPRGESTGSRQLNSANRTPFVCSLCHKSFDSEKYLSMHLPLHKPYVETSCEVATRIPVSAAGTLPNAVGTEAEIVQLLQGGLGMGCLGSGAGKQKKLVTVSSSEVQQWTCQYCQKSFMQNSNYKNHMRTHSDERPFVCEICNIGFKERYHLKKHVLFKHTTDLKETCRICGKCFKDSTAVRAHERIHSELRPYSCNLCGKTFKTSECLWHHENRSKTCGKSALRRNDALAVAAAAAATTTAGAVSMPTLKTEPGSTTGRRVRKPRQSAATSAGGSGAKTRSPRQQSQKAVGGFSQSGTSASTPYSPMDDDKDDVQLMLKRELEASVLSIKTEPDCGDLLDQNLQTFCSLDEQEFQNILEIFDFKDGSSTEETGSDLTDSDTGLARESEDCHGGVKCSAGGLECTKCAKKFSSTATFDKHMVMHNEERPYRCTLCDNGFKLKVHLKKHHLYRHSDEYPCECSICGKRFKDSSAVRLHERIHSSDRPFRCHCGKGFKTRENLWGHRNRGPCDKTQDFIANNIRLFRSAEFGPILGVPISSGPSGGVSPGLGPNHATVVSGSLVDASGRTIAGSNGLLQQAQQSVQAVLLKTTTTTQGSVTSTPHSVQFVPSCVFSSSGFSPGQPSPSSSSSRQVKVATLRLIKPRACDAATYPTSILPTAIVTPIQREGPTQSSNQPDQQSSEATLKTSGPLTTTKHMQPTKTLQNNSISLNRSADFASTHPTANISTTLASPTAAADGAFLKTVAATDLSGAMRGHGQLSVAEKCPTVQKYLERSTSMASMRFLEINSLVGATMVSGKRPDSGHEQQKSNTGTTVYKRQKLNSIGEDNSSTEGEEKTGRIHKQQQHDCGGSEGAFGFADQESQDSGSLPILDPLLPNSPFPACTSMYPDIEDYGDMKYDPNDPTLNIGDMYWGDSDNTLSSGWILENESLFSDLSLTSNFGVL